MEAVNSFVMSWWPVFAGIFGVLVLLAQLWNSGVQREQGNLHERQNAQDERINEIVRQLHEFEIRSNDRFVTHADLGRIVNSIDSMKADVTRWLERLDSQLQNKADKS